MVNALVSAPVEQLKYSALAQSVPVRREVMIPVVVMGVV